MIIFRGMMDIVRVVVKEVEGLGWWEGGLRSWGGGGVIDGGSIWHRGVPPSWFLVWFLVWLLGL